MNLEGLRYVQAVWQTSSFSAAARAYGVTQPALSKGVWRLEEELKIKLFDRTSQGVTPTTDGLKILPMIDSVLGTVDSVVAEARRLSDPVTGALRVGVSALIGADLVAQALLAGARLDSPRGIVLREAELDVLAAALGEGELDILLVPAVAPMPAFRHRTIAHERIGVVNPVDRGDDRGPLELVKAAAAEYILVPQGCPMRMFTEQLFRKNDLPLRTYPGEASNVLVVAQWARLGLGAALLPMSKFTSGAVRPLVRGGVPVEISYEAVWSAESPYAADLQQFVDGLSEPEMPAMLGEGH